jgi:DNA-binding MarR family transcriptional regulator
MTNNQRSIDERLRMINLMTVVVEVWFSTATELTRTHGFSPKHISIVSIIHHLGEEATPSGVASCLFRRPHTISSLLTRMEKAGLIRKNRDLRKRSQVRLSLTKKGLEALKLYNKEFLVQITMYLSDEECLQMKASLQKMQDAGLELYGIQKKAPIFPKPI